MIGVLHKPFMCECFTELYVRKNFVSEMLSLCVRAVLLQVHRVLTWAVYRVVLAGCVCRQCLSQPSEKEFGAGLLHAQVS